MRALFGRGVAALGLLVLATGCGRGTAERVEWGNGNSNDFCQANLVAPQGGMAITLKAAVGASGLSISGPGLQSLDPRGDLPGVTLEVDGAPVRARAVGNLATGEVHQADFYFDPRPLLRRHPDGFEAAVLSGGHALIRIDGRVDRARTAFAGLIACDRKLRFQGEIDTLRDLNASAPES